MTSITAEKANEIADRLFDAIERGDLDGVRKLYTSDTKVWHNTDQVAQSSEQNLATLKWVVENLAGLRYTDVRRSPTPIGFVQQHVLRARLKSGKEVALPACLVAPIEGDHIVRVD